MLDTSGDGRVTSEEFLSAAKSSLEAAKAAQQGRQAGGGGGVGIEVMDVLRKVCMHLIMHASVCACRPSRTGLPDLVAACRQQRAFSYVGSRARAGTQRNPGCTALHAHAACTPARPPGWLAGCR